MTRDGCDWDLYGRHADAFDTYSLLTFEEVEAIIDRRKSKHITAKV